MRAIHLNCQLYTHIKEINDRIKFFSVILDYPF